MRQVRGYWFNTATGEIRDVTVTRHIDELVNTPEAFGLTQTEVVEAFQRSQETLGTEGKAREELITRAVSSTDWVRIREYEGREGYWITANARSSVQRPMVEARFPQFAGYWRWSYAIGTGGTL